MKSFDANADGEKLCGGMRANGYGCERKRDGGTGSSNRIEQTVCVLPFVAVCLN